MPTYYEQPANDALGRSVECGWLLHSHKAITGHRVPPDGCLDIIYDRTHGLRAIGTMTTEQRFDYPEGAWLAGIRFRPGMAGTFLGVSPAELTDTSAPLEDLWAHRAQELKNRLEDAKSIQEAMQIMLGSLPACDVAPNPVQRAIEAITAANGNVDLENVALQANLSPRQFRRRCREESGLGPKHLCRVLRFRHACRLASDMGRLNMGRLKMGRLNWSDIALEAEYFDQAHFIRDFRNFTGLTPMSVFSNTRPRDPASIGA